MRTLEVAKKTVRPARDALLRLAYRGNSRFCPVCERSSRRFPSFGRIPRKDARCVYCGALERHRLEWLFIQQKTNLLDGVPKKMLHVAPETCFGPKLKEGLGSGYLTASLTNPRAMVRMDITDIQFPDRWFDVILCSHVLEHVDDDRRAMHEFFRVLKDEGWAILIVGIGAETTVEDPSITDPKERLLAFGQEDHVRAYGRDYVDRLREAGFDVGVTRASDLMDVQAATKMGLAAASDEIFFCTKQTGRNMAGLTQEAHEDDRASI